MKTSYLKAALVILSLTATTVAQGQVDSDFDKEMTEGKIQAAMAQQKANFNPLHQVVKMKMELNSIEKQIDDLQVEVGTSVDDSNGAVKGLADKMLSVEQLKAHFLSVDAEIQKEHGYGLALRIDEAQQIVKEARKVLQAAKEDAKKAFEPSEK